MARLELKVCERCGGLWLRPAASAWRYCARCKPRVDELPRVDLARRPGPKPRQVPRECAA